jgi:hypothetical protein
LPSELKIHFDVKGSALFQAALFSVSEPLLLNDDTGVIISSKNVQGFCSVSNLVLCCMIKWFAASKFVTHLDKTNVLKFITIHHIMYYTVYWLQSEVYRTDGKYKISWFKNR